MGLFSDDSIIAEYYSGRYASDCGGLFYVGNPWLLLMQLLGAVTIIAWVSVWAVCFYTLAKWSNRLRIRFQDERLGVDIAKGHGEAYPYTALDSH